MRGKRLIKRIFTFSSVLLIVLMLNLTISPTYLALGSGEVTVFNLAPQARIFKPIIDMELSDRGMLEFVVMSAIKKDPSLFIEDNRPTRNMFSRLAAGKTVEALFSNAEKLDLDIGSKFGEKNISAVYVVPCYVDKVPYYVQLLSYNDDSCKISMFSSKEFQGYMSELVRDGFLPSDSAKKMLEGLESFAATDATYASFIDSTDESVRSVEVFLELIGAAKISSSLKERVGAGDVILSKEPVMFPGSILVGEDTDTQARALSILKSVLVDHGVDPHAAEKAFSGFWGLWEQKNEGIFDIDEVDPNLKIMMREIESGIDDQASNEGGIEFRSKAYESTPDLEGYELEDCLETIRDIKMVFRKVAEHDMSDKLKPYYEMYKYNLQIERLVKEEAFEKAAMLRDRIRALEERLGINDENREETAAEYKGVFDSMPGINPNSIRIEDISRLILPTDIVMPDGIVKINQNFVKLMYKISRKGLKLDNGDIILKTSEGEEDMGNLYYSILYALAIHTLRGHFPMDEDGMVNYNSDEYESQGERGNSHIYVNLLAMSYYWIELVERHKYPESRLEVFMEKYPHVFRKLTAEQKKTLPGHLLDLCADLIDRKASPLPLPVVKTVANAKNVENIVKESHPDASSNEGGQAMEGQSKGERYGDLAARVFRAISFDQKGLFEYDIFDDFKGITPEKVSGTLDFLREIGLIILTGSKDAEGGRIARGIPVSLEDKLAVCDILEKEEDVQKIKAQVYEVVDTRWPTAVIDALVDGKYPKALADPKKGEKAVLALEMDWIPDEQRSFILPLIQELEKLGPDSPIEVVRKKPGETAAEFAERIVKMTEDGKVKPENVVVLASESTINLDEFSSIRASDDRDKKKAFMAGVNPGNLTGDSYIRIMEMISMAMRMAAWQDPLSSHSSKIELEFKNNRIVTFIPKIEPIDIMGLKRIYEAQLRILQAA